MTEENGDGLVPIGEVAEALVRRSEQQREVVLRDIEESLPSLRSFLLGGVRNGSRWPAGNIRLSCTPAGIDVVLTIWDLDIESHQTFVKWDDIWQTLDHHIEHDTLSWKWTWSKEKRERAKAKA